MVASQPFRTSADLVVEVLANLGVLAAGQASDPEDVAYVVARLDSIRRMLSALEIVQVSDLEQIPGEWFSPLADIVAGECAVKFGSTPDDITALVNKGLGGANGTKVGSGVAAQALKQMNRGKPTYEPLKAQYL